MKTGAILLRVSTQRQAEDDKASYPVQRAACMKYASENGIDVPRDLIWQEIGKRDQYFSRDGLQAAIAAAKERRYQVLVVWRLDRLSDDPGRLLRLVEELDSYGVSIRYASEPDTETDTELGKWLVYTKALFQVQPERRTLALRTKEARLSYIQQGRAWASHSPTYGYKWIVDPSRVRRDGDATTPLKERMEPCPITAPIIQQIYRWVDAGVALKWIARALSGLEDDGIHRTPTPRQHSGIAGANDEGIWVTGTITKLIGNPAYRGAYAAGRTKRVPRGDGSEKMKLILLPESEWIYVEPSPTPPLVDAALWACAKARLQANKDYSQRNTRKFVITAEQALLFRGMARCGTCGGRMGLKKVSPPDPYGIRRFHYACDAHAHHLSATKCPGVGRLRTEEVDEAVWAALLDTLRQPETLARLARRSYDQDHAEEAGVRVTSPVDEHAALAKKLATKERDLANFTAKSAVLEPGDPAAVGYELQMRSLGAEILTLREDVARAAKRAAKYQRVEKVVGEWQDYLNAWSDSLDYLGMTKRFTPTMQRSWLEAFGAKVFLHRRVKGENGTTSPLATLRLHLATIDQGATQPMPGPNTVDVPVFPGVTAARSCEATAPASRRSATAR